MAKTERTRATPKRGVALILALFTTAILITLSLAFLALAIGESRNSRSASQEKAALEAANYGLEFTLNYMGLGTNTSPLGLKLITWQRDIYPGGFGFYNTLTRVTTPRPHLIANTGIVVEDLNDDPSIALLEPDPNLKPSVRRVRLVKAAVPAGGGKPEAAVLPLGSELAFTFEVVVIPVLPSNGVESFRLISMTKVYRQETPTTVSPLPLVTRAVEAQVLPESAASYLHFLSHGRGLNAQGIEKYSDKSVDIGGKVTSIVDYAMIPGNFSENGPMRVDGEDPALATAPGGAPAWLKTSGSLKFAPQAVDKKSGGNVTFQDRLTIKAGSNDYAASGLDDTNSGFFSGGFTTKSPRLGLPQLDLVNMTKASKYVPNPNNGGYVPGYFSVETREIPGAMGSTVAAPKCNGPKGDPFYERYDPEVVNGETLFVPVPFDYRPRIPNIEISIAADQVTVQKRDTLSGEIVGGTLPPIKTDKLASGVLFVEGGNAVVKSSEPFKGQLSIVAGDHVGRAGANPNDQIYADAASEFFAHERKRWDRARADGGALDPTKYATPPYTVKQLQEAKKAGIVTADVPSLADEHPLWPSPPKAVTREGNLVLADDILTTRDRGSTLGLFAQNFILINDNTPEANNHQLTVDAVLMSRDHSVTLDWDNTARQPLNSWKVMTSPKFNGVLQIRGSIVGEFVDVEGDTEGRGYVVQDFQHNPNLRNLRPPLCPAWDFSLLPGGFRFVITHYSDKGALNTDKAL